MLNGSTSITESILSKLGASSQAKVNKQNHENML